MFLLYGHEDRAGEEPNLEVAVVSKELWREGVLDLSDVLRSHLASQLERLRWRDLVQVIY